MSCVDVAEMFRIALFLAMNFVHAQLNQAPCTEDSHCSIGFYCEETALYCRPCLRCEDHQRATALQEDVCVKSLVQCGDCLKGLVAKTPNGNEKIDAGCVLFVDGTEKYHPYLPPYAWVAIAIGLVLMLMTVFVFLKTKMFKVVSYSSRTSVHSLRAVEAAESVAAAPPPPYNYHLPFAPPESTATEMPEVRRLVDSPDPKPMEPSRPREAAGSQEARVFNSPAYVRIPHSDIRCSSPEALAPEEDAAAAVPVADGGNTLGYIQPTRNTVKLDNNTAGDVQRYGSQNNTSESTQQNRISACARVQDSNNNYPSDSGDGGPKILNENPAVRVFGGPSFVINVVENISNLQQQNHANCFHTDSL